MSSTITVSIKPDPTLLVRAFTSTKLTSFFQAEVNRMAATVERFAKQLTPVDTGRLRSSIHFTPAGLGLQAVVSTNTKYALFVHEGTKYMRGRPFMYYGAALAQVGLEKQLTGRIDKAFVDAFKKL